MTKCFQSESISGSNIPFFTNSALCRKKGQGIVKPGTMSVTCLIVDQFYA